MRQHARHAAFDRLAGTLLIAFISVATPASAQQVMIAKTDTQIDALDPGIKLFLREKMAEGNTAFTDDNVILFLHGATSPSTCDFDLSYKDYSWADWLVKQGYVVYMGDYRNYGGSTREAAMDDPPAKHHPLTRSYFSIRSLSSSASSCVEARKDSVSRSGS
ncbi:hypothetical protein AYJ54_02475 [Bradyrhizobium centrolobii]|uniref:Serine aminopeptidase S33 domain-containing protein n=1 Tax=Bradyrhizobium centrolobii TaxID=1505087 RepID=A0A176YID1_9BRAD|nr:alpha/beta hydrolase [Bradyrhizobium centrolobii]OAF05778.1 hypothetical protein AYJ54_02475 [Bradyrhizobium centrolobii]